MICLIALIVCGVLGLFSAKYRIIAKEAFDCVFRRLTLRKCTSGLDTRLKGQITGNLMKKAPKVGAWTFKHFELISWFFTIILVLSLGWSAYSVYNFARYGNCNGKNSDEFCIFDPLGHRGQNVTEQCSVTNTTNIDLGLVTPNIGDATKIGKEDSNIKIIVFGCYTCGYTQKFDPVFNQLVTKYSDSVLFIYKDFPIEKHVNSYSAAIAAECADNQGKFMEYKTRLFENQELIGDNNTFFVIANSLGLDNESFSKCFNEQETKGIVDQNIEDGINSGIYGTPTVFINEVYFVGPKSYSTYRWEIMKQKFFSIFN